MASIIRSATQALGVPVLILGLLLLSSCETSTPTHSASSAKGSEPGPAFRQVVGRLEVYEEGAPVHMGLFASVSAAAFVVAPRGNGRGQLLDVDPDGAISWKLAPGEYDLVALQLIHRSGSSMLHIDGRLSVSPDSPVVDVGVIRAESGRTGSRVRSIRDGDERGAADVTPPMFLLKSLVVGSYVRVIDICDSRWWIECTKSFRGVEAVEPELNFVLGDPRRARPSTVQPRFRWRSALTAGSVYDLIVWKGIGYKPNLLADVQYVPGPVAFYVEGLHRPEFSDVPPLEPKTRYFWSVRLRDGDTVSSWSTMGHFTFLLVAWSKSSGRLFEFETP